MYHEEHGGGCCGMGHIYNMPSAANLPSLNQHIEDLTENLKDSADDDYVTTNFLIEVVLIASQQPVWEEVLKKRGFNIVNDFVNSNTGNTCYIYHLIEEV